MRKESITKSMLIVQFFVLIYEYDKYIFLYMFMFKKTYYSLY